MFAALSVPVQVYVKTPVLAGLATFWGDVEESLEFATPDVASVEEQEHGNVSPVWTVVGEHTGDGTGFVSSTETIELLRVKILPTVSLA